MVQEEAAPFANPISIELASKTLAWSITVKRAASPDQLRVRSVRNPCVRELTGLRNADEIVLWLGATARARGATFPDDRTLSVSQAAVILDAGESSRLARFLHVEDRMSYLAAHAGARLLLGAIAGLEADRLRFEQSALGKPVLVDAPAGVDFSVSHARGAVAVAAHTCRSEWTSSHCGKSQT